MTILLAIIAILIICLYGFLLINSFQNTINKDGLTCFIAQCWLSGVVTISYAYLIVLLLSFTGIKLGLIGILFFPAIIFVLRSKKIKTNSKELTGYILSYLQNKLNIKSFKDFTKSNLGEIVLIIIFLMYYLLIITTNITLPISEWDSIMIWSLKAKLLFYDKIDLSLFTKKDYAFTQLDYPLLVPFLQAFISKIIGSYNETANKIFFSIMSISFSLILYQFTSKLYKGFLSKLAVLPVILMLVVSWNFTNALADSTLMTFYLAVVVFLYFFLKDPENNKRYLLHISVCALGCLITKNEGLLLILSIFLTSIIYTIRFLNSNKTYFKQLIIHFLVPIFLNLPWVIFIKLNHIENVEGISILSLFDLKLLNKFQDIILALSYLCQKVFLSIGDWGILYIALLILIISAIYCKRTKELLFFIGTYCINLLIILIIYIQSPYGYAYHMGTSVDRVMLSISPLIVCFIIISPSLIEKKEQ